MTYKPIPTKTNTLITEVTTSDDDAKELLKDILVELKIINKYLYLLTEIEIKQEDLQDVW